MKTLITILFVLFISSMYGNNASAQTFTNSTETRIIHSNILGEDRKIHIRIPGKMKTTETYPVLYLLDGEMFLALAGGQVQYLSEAYKIIPNLIIVGIENTDRMRDLTPTHSNINGNGKHDSTFGKTSGGGEKFVQFIKEELIPYVAKNFPVSAYKILAGHSLGGLMAVYCLVNHPDLFNAYIAISPSLQWDQEFMLKQATKKLYGEKSLNKFLFFSDANEGDQFHTNQLHFDSVLNRLDIPGLKYKYVQYPEETHITEPVKAFYDGLRFIYPEWYLPFNTSAFRKTVTASIVKKHYEKRNLIYHYTIIPPHEEISWIGKLMSNDPDRLKDAVEILKINTLNFPTSASAYEQLGDVYLKLNDLNNTRINFQIAYQLDQGNKKLEEKLNSLKQ